VTAITTIDPELRLYDIFLIALSSPISYRSVASAKPSIFARNESREKKYPQLVNDLGMFVL
jgi:hypothetical protein